MKKTWSYLLAIVVITVFISSCHPISLAAYENDLYGAWRLDKVEQNDAPLPFHNGSFSFYPSGHLVYRDSVGNAYDGTWAWRNSRTSNFGMNITLIDFTNHDVKLAFFDEWTMIGKNRAEAQIIRGNVFNAFYFTKVIPSGPGH